MGSNSPSKQKYKEAVNTAREHAFEVDEPTPPSHFDERQVRVYCGKFSMFRGKIAFFDELHEEMAMIHGYEYDEVGRLVPLRRETT